LVERALVDFPTYRPLFKRLFYPHIFTVEDDTILYHTLAYKQKEYSQCSYSESAIGFPMLGYTRQFDKTSKKWIDINQLYGDFVKIEVRILKEVEQRYRYLDEIMMGMLLRICPKDKSIRLRCQKEITRDKRKIMRGQQTQSISKEEFIKRFHAMISQLALPAAALESILGRKNNNKRDLDSFLKKSSRDEIEKQYNHILAYCGHFVMS